MEPKADLRFPTQQELLFPLLEVLAENGPMQAKDACQAVAEKIDLRPELRNVSVSYDDGRHHTNLFDRKTRWVRQNATIAQLIPKTPIGIWSLSEEGHRALTMARPGVVICVSRDEFGHVLWAEALSAMGHIDHGSVNAIITSPPFPLNRQREYGGWEPDRYLDILLEHIAAMKPLLTNDGSLVVSLGEVYLKGVPALNPYQEELVVAMRKLGWSLCGRHVYVNPASPKTTPWVTKSRIRCARATETFYWWSPTPYPKANNREVLQPYSNRFLQTLAAGGEIRAREGGARQSYPGLRFRQNNGGRIPLNFTFAGHEGATSAYSRYCAANGLPRHPALMSAEVTEHFVRLVTDTGDLLYDPFGGSLRVAEVCKRLGRRYLASEKCLEYLKGGFGRLDPQTIEDFTGALLGGPPPG